MIHRMGGREAARNRIRPAPNPENRCTILVCAVCFIALLLGGCREQNPRLGQIIERTRRNLTAADVNVSGITLQMTEEDLSTRLRILDCRGIQVDETTCVWRNSQKVRSGRLRDIDELRFRFRRGRMINFTVLYRQMFDVEYANLIGDLRNKYAPSIGGLIIDTTGTVWNYDSLSVSVIPNEKKHWTGSLKVFTPVLEVRRMM